MKISWTEPAVNALQDIHDFISKDSEFYAARFIERIIAAAEKVRDFPGIGRKVPEADRDDVREVIMEDYRIIYRIMSDQITILTVVHGSRNLAAKNKTKPWDLS